MNFTKELLTILGSRREGYRVKPWRISGYSDSKISGPVAEAPGATVRVVLSRLKKRGLVENREGIWRITEQGKEYLSHNLFHPSRETPPDKRPKNMIVSFDIPERHRKKRDWLRVELRNLGFEMLQRSVWFGRAPLPEDFIHRLKILHILGFIKFFKSEEWDIV